MIIPPKAPYPVGQEPIREEAAEAGPSKGEQEIYDALIELSSEIFELAENMKCYQYPSKTELKIRLGQKSFSTGGTKRKGKTARLQVQNVLEEIAVINESLDPLHDNIKEAQRLCFFKDTYKTLTDTHKSNKIFNQLKATFNRREDQRKLRNKREKDRRKMQQEELDQIDEIFNNSNQTRWS